ncbi:MAG: leucyl aminopeptidase [Gammaproteobacteria bacterium]|nr:leucyl aminopeptidase [Gammaproteobacteria bacterium]
MNFFVSSAAATRQRTDCAIVGIYKAKRLSADAAALDKASSKVISKAIAAGDIDGKLGATYLISHTSRVACKRILLVGLGNKKSFDEEAFKTANENAIGKLAATGSSNAINYLTRENVAGRDTYGVARLAAAAADQGIYRYDELKSKKPGRPKVKRLGLAAADKTDEEAMESGAKDASAINAGVELARDLGNRPANICTPGHLADQARDLAKRYKSVKTKILNRADMKKMGMGAFLSVTAGAAEPPHLIVMEYSGGEKDDAPIALVGKGITFDTGGISIKPAAGMDEMKYDMCGAASVLGTMFSLARLRLDINVVAIIPTCENMPSGTATRPGDIVTTMSGQTVEILNTDAEGRLILCDALTYARQFKPAAVIDIATLTGACVIALGAFHSGLMTKDDDLAAELLAAGRTAADVAWQLPLTDDYAKSLESNFADFANVGGRPGGAITAGCYLAKFTDGLSWAHLDIAGSAWKSGKEKGATGRPVGLLSQFLIDRARSS